MVQEERMARDPRQRVWQAPAIALAALAGAFVLICASTLRQDRSELFGVDAVGPMSGADVSSYGPENFKPDRAMRRAIKEHENTEPLARSKGNFMSHASAMAELGPQAAAKLSSKGFAEALKELRSAPSDTSRSGKTQALAQSSHVGALAARNQGRRVEKRFGWHPGRETFSRGSGEGLIESAATQQALKEMRAHEVRFHTASPPSAQEQYTAARAVASAPEQRLFETELLDDAGFGRKHESRGPSAERAEDRFSQTMKIAERAMSGLRRHKVARVEEEGEHPKGAHGRTWNRALNNDAQHLQQIRTAIDLKETDMHSLQNEERARAIEARDLSEHALGLERKEMAAYGRAELQRNDALRLAHSLLLQKKKARALERKVKFEEKQVHNNAEDGLKLQQQGSDEEKAFEAMTGPIKKAEEDVHIANQAYTKSELALATAETTAERLATHPRLAQEAMARIKQLRAQSTDMAHLIKEASARLHTLQNANGPASFTDGIDAHFSSAKKRAIRKLQKARNLQEAEDALKAKEKLVSDKIKRHLPALHAQIKVAKELHNKYLSLHNAAEAAQQKADKAKVQDLKLKRAVHFDATVLSNVKRELEEDRSRYATLAARHPLQTAEQRLLE